MVDLSLYPDAAPTFLATSAGFPAAADNRADAAQIGLVLVPSGPSGSSADLGVVVPKCNNTIHLSFDAAGAGNAITAGASGHEREAPGGTA